MKPRPPLELAHHHPGRLRVRSDALCGANGDAQASERFERIRLALVAMDAVRSVHLNERAGSVLVDYEPGAVDPNALIDATARAADLDPPASEDELRERRAKPAWVAIGAARELNTLTRELTAGRADLRDVVPMAMSGLAAYSFIVGKDRLPRWDNLAYWAFSIFMSLHTTELAEGEDRTT